MSLELAAQHLASRGRKGDTMLVHMAPEEVSGLQALARAGGGTLTTNPDTGLPEANFLKRMLPMIIGAGLAATGVGAPMAAMLVGGVQTARTGSLGKGLMAGLGAYGGAGLAGSLMGAGATPLAGMETAALENPAVAGFNTPNLAGAGAGAGAGSGVVVNPVPLTPSAEIMGAVPGGPSLAESLNLQAQQQAAQAAVGATPQVATATPPPPASPTFSQNLSQMGRGLGEIGKDPSRFMTADNLKYGLSALTPAMMGKEPEQYKGSGPNPYNFAFDWERPEGPSYDSREAMQLQGRLRRIPSMAAGGPIEEMSQQNRVETMMANGGQMFAEGGETKADVAKGMTGASADAFRYLMGQSAASPATLAAQNLAAAKPASMPLSVPQQTPDRSSMGITGRLMEDDPNQPYNFNFDPISGQLAAGPRIQRPVVEMPPPLDAKNGGLMSMARGGISHLGDYSDGGRLLKGPGDGVSDSIPATIANKRPARLADGEFVVPARIVSELGNGSTEAGARKLYAMMDRVQKARKKSIGKNKVAVNSRAEKLLPA
jgi:hypothetical protein